MIRAWAGLDFIRAKNNRTGMTGVSDNEVQVCGRMISRRGHFVPVNELMSIFEQIWETRKHIHDLKKYPQCKLH